MIESNDKDAAFEDKQDKQDKQDKSRLDKNNEPPSFLKWAGLFIAVVTMIGFSFQRGAILQMGLGYSRGSYELNDIYYFSALGISQLFDELSLTDLFWEILGENWILSIIFLVVFITFFFGKEIHRRFIKGNENEIKEFFYCENKIYRILVVGFLGTIFGWIVALIQAAGSILILASIAFLLLPIVVGDILGRTYIKNYYLSPPCGVAANATEYIVMDKSDVKKNGKDEHGEVSIDKNEEKSTKVFITQCTQIKHKDKFFSGKVVFESSSGIFVYSNESFAYLSNDGTQCHYSRYVDKASIKDIDTYDFSGGFFEKVCSKPLEY